MQIVRKSGRGGRCDTLLATCGALLVQRQALLSHAPLMFPNSALGVCTLFFCLLCSKAFPITCMLLQSTYLCSKLRKGHLIVSFFLEIQLF